MKEHYLGSDKLGGVVLHAIFRQEFFHWKRWRSHLFPFFLCFSELWLSTLLTLEFSKHLICIWGFLLQLWLNHVNQSVQTTSPEFPERNIYLLPWTANEFFFSINCPSLCGRGQVLVTYHRALLGPKKLVLHGGWNILNGKVKMCVYEYATVNPSIMYSYYAPIRI